MTLQPLVLLADEIEAAVACLNKGGVVLSPTDTVLGLAAKPDQPEAIAKIFALKGRPAHKSLPIMAASLEQIADLGGHFNEAAHLLMDSQHWPGNLSLVVSLDQSRAPAWLTGRDEIAFRIPNHAGMQAILSHSGPLLVTSANASGHPTPATSAEAVAQLTAEPDLVIEGQHCSDTPSTIVNCRPSPPKLEREGAVSSAVLLDILGELA